jgi:uncharacterized protein DUF1203
MPVRAQPPVVAPGREAPMRGRNDAIVRVAPIHNEMPDVLRTRLLSVRAFDRHGLLRAADVAWGQDLERVIESLLTGSVASVAHYLHVHNAKPGDHRAP